MGYDASGPTRASPPCKQWGLVRIIPILPADEAGATGWFLRSTLSLAQLRRDAGRERQAAAVLGPAIARAVDGVGTKDFDNAQELLLQAADRKGNLGHELR